MTLKLYLDFMSQPSRALYIYLKLAKIPFEPCLVALRKGEHLSLEFKEKHSRFQKVPFIHHGDFQLNESIAIIRYLAREFNVPDYLYPENSVVQAKVDEYLEWQHNNIRAFCALYFQRKWLQPLITGEQPPPETIQKFKDNMDDCLKKFEELWLSQGHTFVAGNKLSIADIIAACEIEQPRLCGDDAREGRPILNEWIEKVRSECNPFYDEAHAIMNKIIAKSNQGVKAKL